MCKHRQFSNSHFLIWFNSLQFVCYLEDCKFKFETHEARKDHAIKEHNFPHDFYDFKDIIVRKEEEPSKKPFIQSFHFGSKSQKTFNSKPPTKIDVKDLMDALPN